MPQMIDLTGRRIGRWTVLGKGEPHVKPSGKPLIRWRCRCDCGSEAEVIADSLLQSLSLSCGCLNREKITTHGATVRGASAALRRTHKIWDGAKQRCEAPSSPSYEYYGARGIKVCDRWRNDFAAFLADMGECPPGHSIERDDVNGHYEPGNCKWIPLRDQPRNTRQNVWIEYRGQKMIRSDFARLVGQHHCTVRDRLARGWTVEQVAAGRRS